VRFLRNAATSAEIALVANTLTMQSGSCSYDIQSETSGNDVLSSISLFMRVCESAIYTFPKPAFITMSSFDKRYANDDRPRQ